jgi:hypothetical protein
MAFSSAAAAYMHVNEHALDESHSHHHFADVHSHDHLEQDNDTDHGHHFHLHVVGDIAENDPLSFSKQAYSFGHVVHPRLTFRTYTPPIPPPNA